MQQTLQQTASGLSHAFRQELDKLPNSRDNRAGTLTHKYQTEYCYIMDMLQRGSIPEGESAINNLKRLVTDMRSARQQG